MNRLDEAIREALSEEDAAILAQFEGQSPLQEALGAFSGKRGALNALAALMTFVMFAGAAYCAWSAFAAPDIRETVLWSSGALFAVIAVGLLKMYFWMEMNKNATLREVKRLELQVARLASSGAV